MAISAMRLAVFAAIGLAHLTSTTHAQPVCRGDAITVRASASGTLYNATSSQMIKRSTERQLTRKWRALALRRAGRP